MKAIGVHAAGFDERQVGLRNRAATSSFLVMLVLVCLNGWLDDSRGQWGSGLTQALTLVFLGMGVFLVQAVWFGAYWRNTRVSRAMVALFALVALVDAVTVSTGGAVWHDGRAGAGFVLLVQAVFFGVLAAVTMTRLALDARAEQD